VLAEAAQASCGSSSPSVAAASFAGAEVCDRGGCVPVALPDGAALPPPQLALPEGYGFDALPAGAPERILGVEAAVLAFAIDATPEELAPAGTGACPLGAVAGRLAELWSARQHVLSVKRVQIRGPEAPDARNRNPSLAGIDASETPLAADARTAVAAGTIALAPVLPDAAAAMVDVYTELDTAGAPLETKLEEWAYSWFSTAGEIEELHTRGSAVAEWKVGAGETALVAAVVRDLRGGVAWQVREVTVGLGGR
jgi:hypothetical protein